MALDSRALSPYERQREERIRERKAFLQELFPKDQLLELKRELAVKPHKPRQGLRLERPRRGSQTRINGPIRRSARLRSKKTSVYPLDDESDEEYELPKSRRSINKRSVPTVIELDENQADFDPEELKRVATTTGDKVYDSYHGSTCHQCRQKTRDMKTRCRNIHCVGVRGQFCGPCLRNRYGEDAEKALQDETWVCPPCRQVCNCSFCLPKRGRRCTGIMIHLARDAGFDNVHSFLQKSP